jgi:hypothetical protein
LLVDSYRLPEKMAPFPKARIAAIPSNHLMMRMQFSIDVYASILPQRRSQVIQLSWERRFSNADDAFGKNSSSLFRAQMRDDPTNLEGVAALS